MHKTIFSLFFLLLLYACEKETISEYELVPTVDENITLSIKPQPDKSKVSLVWTSYQGNDFREYSVMRHITVLEDGKFTLRNSAIAQFGDAQEHMFTDEIPENTVSVQYNIVLVLQNRRAITSNMVEVEEPGKYQNGTFSDVLINTDKKLLYFMHFGTGTIKVQSYDSMDVVATDSLYTGISYSTLGYFDGQQELYVPTADGWLMIYDAATLARKDRIFIGGENVRSVAAADGKLIVSASDGREHPDNLKIYDRKDKSLISRTGFYKNTRLVHLKNSSPTTFVDITFSVLPQQLSYYKFYPDGTTGKAQISSFKINYTQDDDILRSFPDGSKFIASTKGVVYRSDLTYEKHLPLTSQPYGGNDTYTDYAFNADGSVIYAALLNGREIKAIRYPDIITERTFQTTEKPFRLFRDGNQLIVVTTINSQYVYPSRIYYLIEKFNL